MVINVTRLIPDSLRAEELNLLWQKVRQRLDNYGTDRRGRLQLPLLSDSAALTVTSLLDGNRTSTIDLAVLEKALCDCGVGDDLDSALLHLGFAPNPERAATRAASEQRRTARDSVVSEIDGWNEPWSERLAEWLFRSGVMAHADATTAVERVQSVRRLMDYITQNDEMLARNDLAVKLYGSAHALDDSTPLERCARRALWHMLDESIDYRQRRLVWNAAGITTDRVSTPVLTWQLPLQANTSLGKLCAAAQEARVPLHLSLHALTENEIVCRQYTKPVLVVENPRLVEVAAERQLSQSVIAANGNPASSVTTLVQAMVDQGVVLRYHGDFDAAGISICRRMMAMGCKPWRMNKEDYEAALQKAQSMSLQLPEDETPCGETPWDPTLQHSMRALKKVVHEEFLIDELI